MNCESLWSRGKPDKDRNRQKTGNDSDTFDGAESDRESERESVRDIER